MDIDALRARIRVGEWSGWLGGDKHLLSFDEEYLDNPNRPARVHLLTCLADHAGVKPEREFFLLAALGSDLFGAVTVMPKTQMGPCPTPDSAHLFRATRRRTTHSAFLWPGFN